MNVDVNLVMKAKIARKVRTYLQLYIIIKNVQLLKCNNINVPLKLMPYLYVN